MREQAAQKLGDWSHASFMAETASLERLLAGGNVPAADTVARQILTKCLAAGETAYLEAAYDIALAHFYSGRVLRLGGAAEAALRPFAEAQRRFQHLADTGIQSAERMVPKVIGEVGVCLIASGRLESAQKPTKNRLDD